MATPTRLIADILKNVEALARAEASGTEPAAHAQLLKAVNLLSRTVETPPERLTRIQFQTLQNLSIRIATEKGMLRAIVARKGQHVTAAELATDTSTDELLIIRVMRIMTAIGICDETGEATYTSNPTTELAVQKGTIAMDKHMVDMLFPVGGKLVEVIRGPGLHQFPEKPNEQSPFEYTYGVKLFEYLAQNQEQKEAFDDCMAARRDAARSQWFETYPAIQRLGSSPTADDAVLLVDIGGGLGHEAAKFRHGASTLPGRVILQDLPNVINAIRTPLAGVELMCHDFFTAQPVKGARAYYLRSVLHDWSDKQCRAILAHIVDAMDAQHSVVLLDEYVLPNTGAEVLGAEMDILMMLYPSGMERTRRQWEALLDSVGLEIAGVWSSEMGYESVIEARVKMS